MTKNINDKNRPGPKITRRAYIPLQGNTNFCLVLEVLSDSPRNVLISFEENGQPDQEPVSVPYHDLELAVLSLRHD